MFSGSLELHLVQNFAVPGIGGGVVLVVVLYALPPFSSKSVCILRGLFEFVSTEPAELPRKIDWLVAVGTVVFRDELIT